MSTVSASQVVLAIALIFGLAMAAQLIAPRLRIPSLVLLLPIGFIFGMLAPQLRMDAILGPLFPVAINLMVAIILFQGGMALTSISLDAGDKTVVRRLVWIGGAVTAVAAAGAAHLFLGFEWPLAFMLGAILIVSGPTVVTPILDFARPNARVRGVLMWEGTLLDPLGALVAVLVFQIIRASDAATTLEAIAGFFGSVLVAVLMAVVGTALFVIGGRLAQGNRTLGTQVLLGTVILSAGLANVIAQDSGLLTALLLGMVAPRMAEKFNASLSDATPFFGTIVSVGIGVLFISIAALVPLDIVMSVLWPTLAVVAFLMLIVRPLVAWVATLGSSLGRPQRAFIACMDPRGIVAAATASSTGAMLVALKVSDADELLPVAFIIIFATVVIYSLSSVPLARALRVTDENLAD